MPSQASFPSHFLKCTPSLHSLNKNNSTGTSWLDGPKMCLQEVVFMPSRSRLSISFLKMYSITTQLKQKQQHWYKLAGWAQNVSAGGGLHAIPS